MASRRQARALCVEPRERPPAVQSVLSGRPRRRAAREAAGALRRVRRVQRERHRLRLHADVAGLPHVEALSRRLGARSVALQPQDVRVAQSDERSCQRRPADVARQHRLLRLRSRREPAQQHLGARCRIGQAAADYPVHRLRHHVSLGRSGLDRVSGRRTAVSHGLRIREGQRSADPRRDRRDDAAAADGEGRGAHQRRLGVADRQARGLWRARGDRHGPGGKRRRRQPHAHVRRCRALSPVVTRWKDRRVLERQERRIRTDAAARRRLGQRAEGDDARAWLPLYALLVAGQQEAGIHRPGDEDSHLRRGRKSCDRHRPEPRLDQSRRPRAVSLPVVAGLTMADLCASLVFHEQQRGLPLRHEGRQAAAGDVGLPQRHAACLRSGRQVSLLRVRSLLRAGLRQLR